MLLPVASQWTNLPMGSTNHMPAVQIASTSPRAKSLPITASVMETNRNTR